MYIEVKVYIYKLPFYFVPLMVLTKEDLMRTYRSYAITRILTLTSWGLLGAILVTISAV
jgi:hypothetical protein